MPQPGLAQVMESVQDRRLFDVDSSMAAAESDDCIPRGPDGFPDFSQLPVVELEAEVTDLPDDPWGGRPCWLY